MTKKFVEEVPASTLREGGDGSYEVVLITPGQGASAYYHEHVIREYAPAALPKGTHVYLDHLDEGEKRTPAKLLGVLKEDTWVDDEGRARNRFQPLKKHAEWIEEVKDFVGLSVSIAGEGRMGEVDGRRTRIAESFLPAVTNTVDLVSYAGRGGRFLESYLEEANAFEEDAQRTRPEASGGTTKGNETDMAYTEEQVTALIESVEGLVAAMTEAAKPAAKEEPSDAELAADRKAAIAAVRAVESADISDETKAELIEGIEAGNYDVASAIEKEVRLKESLREEFEQRFNEEVGASSAAGAAGGTDPYAIAGWSK